MPSDASTQTAPQPEQAPEPSVVDTAPEPTTVDKALMRYDLALAPILDRTGGIGLVSHHELRAILLAFRAGLAGAFNYMADPTDDEAPTGESRDMLAEQRAAARAASVNQPAPVFAPSEAVAPPGTPNEAPMHGYQDVVPVEQETPPESPLYTPPTVAPVPGEAAEAVVGQDEAQNASIIAESQSNLTSDSEEYVAS